MGKVKESNFELVKIVAMLMIVCHHLVTQNAYNIDTELVGLNGSRVFLQLIGNHAFIGNNLFFMVSAWFLCTKVEAFQLKTTVCRIWSLEKVMLFYSIGIPLMFMLLPSLNGQTGGGNLLSVRYLFPICTGEWWYPTSYTIFLVLYPFYQQGLQALTKRDIKCLIIAMACLWTVPSIIPVRLSLGANNTTCFFMLYAMIFYIRKFKPEWAVNPKVYKCLTIGGYVLAFLSILVLDVVGLRLRAVSDYACYYIRGNGKLLPVLISVGVFLWATQWKIGYNKVINWVGGLTFAVYLIHMHPLMVNLLFKQIFIVEPYINSPKLAIFTIGATLLIFMACILVEQCRNWLYNGIRWVWSSLRKYTI